MGSSPGFRHIILLYYLHRKRTSMSILENIKTASVEARKAKAPSASLLVTLLSEVAMVGKNANRETTDAEAIAVVKKFLKNNEETLSRVSDAGVIATLGMENSVLVTFMPKQMTEADIRAAAGDLLASLGLSGPKAMGQVLKEFKQKYEGTYDGAVASRIVKELLC